MTTLEKELPLEVSEAEDTRPSRLFVEIGTSYNPATFQGRRAFGESDIYIGFDKDMRTVQQGKEKNDWVSDRHGKNVFFAAGDGTEMPLKNESADELYFGNVFGDPGAERQEDFHKRLLTEAQRLLRNTGTLIIGETNTPHELESLTKKLQESGFEVESVLHGADPAWESEMRQYSTPAARAKYGYCVRAKKIQLKK